MIYAPSSEGVLFYDKKIYNNRSRFDEVFDIRLLIYSCKDKFLMRSLEVR